MDTAGTVFVAQDVVYREISPAYREAALKFLKSELFEELVSKRLFPKTRINDESLASDEWVLEHERAPFVLYGWEWSFSMLRDAALTILTVAELSERHGYHLQDAHVRNVVFFSGRPMFVDFGSFREGPARESFPREEFFRYAYIPLMLWSDTNFFFANRMLQDIVPRRLQPFLDMKKAPLLCKYMKPFIKRRRLVYWSRTIVNMVRWQIPMLRKALLNVSRYQERVEYEPQKIRRRIESICIPQDNTEWARRRDTGCETGVVSPRFSRILEIIGGYPWDTAVDIGGDSGCFTELLARRFKHARLLCLDYDSRAVDSQYCRFRGSPDLSERVTVGMVNIMHPEDSMLELEDRIQADLVLALAITDHLILRQEADTDVLLESFSRMTRRYFAVEFMPLGLWTGASAPPIPEWYTTDWFKERLGAYFSILVQEKTEPNRILFVCEKVRAAQQNVARGASVDGSAAPGE
jgi:hypothetical protein